MVASFPSFSFSDGTLHPPHGSGLPSLPSGDGSLPPLQQEVRHFLPPRWELTPLSRSMVVRPPSSGRPSPPGWGDGSGVGSVGSVGVLSIVV